MNDNQKTITVKGIDYRLRLEHDTDTENPFDNDEGLGIFYSFRRHVKNRDEGITAMQSNSDAVALSVYSHSGEYWSVQNELPVMMQCPWDSVGIAGCWVPNDCLMTELKGLEGKERREKCLLFARQAMETLNQYLSGDVYGYIIEKCKHCDSCGHDDWEHLDSCWGFYGHEYAMQEGDNMLQFYSKQKAA